MSARSHCAAPFFTSAERLAELIHRDLICARAGAGACAPSGPSGAGGASAPAALASSAHRRDRRLHRDFSGEAYSEAAVTRWTWSGRAVLDAAQDQGPLFPPPNGAPPGSYRTFTATTGGVDITVEPISRVTARSTAPGTSS